MPPLSGPGSAADLARQQFQEAVAYTMMFVGAFQAQQAAKVMAETNSLGKSFDAQRQESIKTIDMLAKDTALKSTSLDRSISNYKALSRTYNLAKSSAIRSGAVQKALKERLARPATNTIEGRQAKEKGSDALRAAQTTRNSLEQAALTTTAAMMADIADGQPSPKGKQLLAALTGKSAETGKPLTFVQAAKAYLAVSTAGPVAQKALDTISDRVTRAPEPNVWLAKAFRSIGVTESSARKMPATELNARITGAYARMYLKNPLLFQWAGLASLASSAVGRGQATAIALSQDETIVLASALSAAPLPSRIYEGLRIGNLAVFSDLYWQHMTYSESRFRNSR